MTNKTFPRLQPLHRINKTYTQQTLKDLKPGLSGINETLNYMRGYVNEYKTNPYIRELALHLTKNLYQKDFQSEVIKLFDYVQNRIRYIKDIENVETLQTPLKTLEYGQGDCDDKTVLLASLLESIGHKTRFHAVGFQPDHISHVLLEVNLFGKWIPLETTEPVNMGWLPPNIVTSIYR